MTFIHTNFYLQEQENKDPTELTNNCDSLLTGEEGKKGRGSRKSGTVYPLQSHQQIGNTDV